MDYTTCMAIISICLFAMGCLCCIWVTCCGITLMETKFETTFQNFSNYIGGAPECNINLPHEEYQSQASPIKTIMNEVPCLEENPNYSFTFIPRLTSNQDINSR